MRLSPSRPRNNRTRTERLGAEIFGRRGEALAAWYLRLKGYRIVEQRVKSPVGEIDLVARRFGTTVFVEVKARKTPGELGLALEAVNTRRIARAAQHYVGRHPGLAAAPLRFDVIFLAPWAWPRHVKGAFDASQE
ncbi:YraN family protein [Devosia sp. ZB163]|uniref:YraN family protein n=1 Tax=Devosia sp. ZB163 TaxID=3025938 RepID=UPI002360087B|nr:YraN family protein [Devosia sp. ZB163]MDC9822522.1 YraN family protein [Devosia sp. ZB163]